VTCLYKSNPTLHFHYGATKLIEIASQLQARTFEGVRIVTQLLSCWAIG